MNPDKLSSRSSFIGFVQSHRKFMAWLSIYIIMIIFSSRHLGLIAAAITSTATIAPLILLWATLLYFLLPRLLHKNRTTFFCCLVLLITVLVAIASHIDLLLFQGMVDHSIISPNNDEGQADPNRGRFFLHAKYACLLLSTATTVIITYMLEERREQLQNFEQQKMQEQVKYLRAQINPHFLFNALNCIYALTVVQDEEAPDSVLKLSDMLRYIIDDCRADEVLLTKEVRYIQNYIDFQRIRMEQEPNLTFETQIANPNFKIPPMILQPIIENCFKHSRLVDDHSAWVHITIRQNDSGLLFTCDNSKPAATSFTRQTAIVGRKDEERTGIGLMNVQQRLAVLFGDKCSLKVIEDDSHYKTILHI